MMPQFILIIREDLSRYPMPSEELNAIISAHRQWARDLMARGIFKDGNGIGPEGFLLESKSGEVTVQPLRDVHEGVGGYYLIEAENLDAAVEIAKSCPTFSAGDLVEVRPIM